MTKEEIIEKHANERVFDNLMTKTERVVIDKTLAAMQEYADQETAALRSENERLRGLIPDGFNIWLSNNGWLYHNSGGYYYKRNCEWPPKQNEMSDYADLLKQFKTENNL